MDWAIQVMTSRAYSAGLRLVAASAGASIIFASAAYAEAPQPSVWPQDITSASEDVGPAGENAEDAAEGPPTQTVDLADPDIDWSQLDTTSAAAGNPKPLSAPKAGRTVQDGPASTWAARDTANGSAVSVKQPLSPFWDTRVGADMTVTRQRSALTASELLSEKIANGGSQPQSSGAAWAAATAPGVGAIWDKTAIEARIDPSQEQSRFGTSLSKSLPLGEQYSLTLQNGYNMVQQGIAPVPGIAGRALRNYGTDQSAKLSIADTGTSLVAGQSLTSSEDKWLRTIGAEQKLFGGISVSGSIGETLQGTPSKSLSAGFKRSW